MTPKLIILGLTLRMTLTFYKSAKKGLKLKVRKFWGLICRFTVVTEKKLVWEPFWTPILNKVQTVF